MSFYMNWFLADETDAEAISNVVTTEATSFEDWPILSIKNIGEIDLEALWGILRGDPESDDEVTGKLLFQDGDDVYVCRVENEFIEALSSVKTKTIKRLATEWNKTEELSEWSVEDLVDVIRDLVKFAGEAKRLGKPVLQLSVL